MALRARMDAALMDILRLMTVAGITRPVISTNGQFPGPPLRINQGDNVLFLVDNRCPFNTTIHFHGIEQLGTPWSDGVPGVSQRSIKPQTSFLYRWKATEYGAYWYHAHHRGSLEDGLYGPIYITPEPSGQKPFNQIATNPAQLNAMIYAERMTRPVLLSEWRALTSEQIWAAEVASGTDSFCANALLINGKGSVSCLPRAELDALTTPAQRRVLGAGRLTDLGCFPPNFTDAVFPNFPKNYSAVPPTMFEGCVPSRGPQEVFTVNASQQYVSLDLTSTAGLLQLTFSIDEHVMWVYAIDGRYIQPRQVNALTIPNSNRYSVLVPLDKPRGDYTVRMASASVQQILNTTAIWRYQGPRQLNRPSNPWILVNNLNATTTTVFLNESLVVPFPAIAPSTDIAQTFFLHVSQVGTAYRWRLGNSSYGLELEEAQPLLFNQHSIPSDLIIRTKNNTWVDIIIQVDTIMQPMHPIHKHSNKHFIIGEGTGTFNWSTVAEAVQAIPGSFNLQTPQYRDTYNTPVPLTGPTWLALRYHVVNPGAWLMHCHIQVHQSGGMALAILDGVDAWPTIPQTYLRDSGF
ncbi:Multicopper oxidase type 2 [Penicillium sp. DV-2018c]|nr:Multicopper oxidase type 2 [Penicillium sp. DV-2018c]